MERQKVKVRTISVIILLMSFDGFLVVAVKGVTTKAKAIAGAAASSAASSASSAATAAAKAAADEFQLPPLDPGT